ncbi:MAG: hypothetical protein OTJ97_09675, partial [SAR202 cluster bacterium]|nr:hypothetical protein [SAR202 cluster bacterium]
HHEDLVVTVAVTYKGDQVRCGWRQRRCRSRRRGGEIVSGVFLRPFLPAPDEALLEVGLGW